MVLLRGYEAWMRQIALILMCTTVSAYKSRHMIPSPYDHDFITAKTSH